MDRTIKFKKDGSLTRNSIKKLKVFAQEQRVEGKLPSLQDLIDDVPKKYRKGKTKKAKKNKALKYLVNEFNIEMNKRRKKIKSDITKDLKKLKRYNEEKIDNITLDIKSPEELVNAIKTLRSGGRRTMMEIRGRKVMLNDRNVNSYLREIEDVWVEESPAMDSFGKFVQNVIVDQIIKFKSVPLPTKELIQGAFFPYTHNLKGIDLSSIQIYEEVRASNYDHSCFVHSLIEYGLNDDKINHIKLMIKSRELPQKKIKEIAEKLDLCIEVRRIESNRNLRRYGKKNDNPIKLGLIEGHYFLIKKLPITSFAIKNYDNLKDEYKWWKIFKYTQTQKKFSRSKERYIDSFQVVKLLMGYKENLLNPIGKCTQLYKSVLNDKVSDILTLDNNDCVLNLSRGDFIERRIKNKDFIKDRKTIFFDFETTTDGDEHIPYLCRIDCSDELFEGEDCGEKMLGKIVELVKNNYGEYKGGDILLIAHNAKYDFRFIYEYLSNLRYLPRDSSGFITAGGRYYYGHKKSLDIKIVDSYNMISKPLSKFGKMFNLEQEKEIIPYELYSRERVKKRFIDLEECVKYAEYQFDKKNILPHSNNIDEINEIQKKLRGEMIEEYIKNIKKWDCLENGKVDIIKYSSVYCKIDCDVLKKGYEKFREWILSALKLDIKEYLTSASIADAYLTSQDVYRGVYKVGGVVREFIQKCMVGGRTMLSENKKYHSPAEEVLGDFDATSLYPSAMFRLNGYPKGPPEILNKDQINMEFLKNTTAYFIEIIIKKVGKHRKFSLMSRITEDGIREFTNDMVGATMHVDNIMLEDMIKFQQVEFEIVRGYYYNDGVNNKISEVMKYLFSKRLEMKKVGNPIQEVYKLIMNSAYGKTLLKPIDTENKMIKNESLNNHLAKYYNHIKSAVELRKGKYHHVKHYKPTIDHYNNCPCGVLVLSMSKRIMNEVMTLAEDKGINIYYQDTDSMHIVNNGIEPLAEEYKKIYNRELVGKNLGQFHCDFESDKIKSEPYAVESYFLGKKCYIDKLEGKDENGETVHDYHIRMKGVSLDAIKHYSGVNEKTLMEVYKDLYDGEELEFDLCCGGKKAMFEFNPDMSILSLPSFPRKIKF